MRGVMFWSGLACKFAGRQGESAAISVSVRAEFAGVMRVISPT